MFSTVSNQRGPLNIQCRAIIDTQTGEYNLTVEWNLEEEPASVIEAISSFDIRTYIQDRFTAIVGFVSRNIVKNLVSSFMYQMSCMNYL